MTIFTNEVITGFETKQPISKLIRNGKSLIDEFIRDIKADKNLSPQLAELYSIMEDVGNNLLVPRTKYKRLNLRRLKYCPYEAKTSNLRLYVFRDDDLGILIVIGGKKTEQTEDLRRLEKLIKEYSFYKSLNHK